MSTSPSSSSAPATRESVGSWLGINRATGAVLVALFGLGLSEELWRGFFGPYLKSVTQDLPQAVLWLGAFSTVVNLLEGFGYIIGGTFAHRMGARSALIIAAFPVLAGFAILLGGPTPLLAICGALLITNWEPLSVPATFDIVGTELPKERRTIAFAMQSIQKRLPKVLGPLIGGIVFAWGFSNNILLAVAVLALSMALQWGLLGRMRPKGAAKPVPVAEIMQHMTPELRRLLTAEIFLRWGDWFTRDMAALYVLGTLGRSPREWGTLLAISSATALATYIPMGKLVDRAPSPKPFIGLTFALFALFPINLVLLPRLPIPAFAALALVFMLNGLRELGEPARKSMITNAFPSHLRAQAVGWYWGMRSFAFCLAPLVAAGLWQVLGPDTTFLIAGGLGMLGTAWFWVGVNRRAAAG